MAKRTAKERVLTVWADAYCKMYVAGYAVYRPTSYVTDSIFQREEIGCGATPGAAWLNAASRLASARD